MRNIARCPSKYVLKKYDLKGSTFDRKVIKSKSVEQNSLTKSTIAMISGKTLKDIDFLNLEK